MALLDLLKALAAKIGVQTVTVEVETPVLTLRDLLRAMNYVEDEERHLDGTEFYGDGGASRGPLQIQRPYHIDAGNQFAYENVDYWRYAVRDFFAYMSRYVQDALVDHDFETLARVHNGGPYGHVSINDHPNGKREKTDPYWAKVRKQLDLILVEKQPKGANP